MLQKILLGCPLTKTAMPTPNPMGLWLLPRNCTFSDTQQLAVSPH